MRGVSHPAMWVLAIGAAVLPCAALAQPSRQEGAADPLVRLAERLTAAPEAASAADAAAETPDEALPTGEDRPLGAATSSNDSRLIPPADVARQDGGWVLSTLAALGLVIGLILLARWGWSKMGGAVAGRSSSVVEVLSRTTVAPRNQVLLLRVGGRVLVVGDSSAGLRTLANIEDPDEVASVLEAVTAARSTSISRGFSQLLAGSDRAFDDPVRVADEGGDRDEYRFDRARDSVSSLLSRIRTMSGKEGAA